MDLPAGFALAAVLEREDPADAFVSDRHASLDDAAAGRGGRHLEPAPRWCSCAPCGPTCASSRCAATSTRGCASSTQGGYDAIVLAAAGLIRLGLGARIRARFDAEAMLPAAGQGALGIEIRADATALGERLATLTHRPTWLAVLAERAVSRTLGGSCSVPIAAHAVWRDEPARAAGGGRRSRAARAAAAARAGRRRVDRMPPLPRRSASSVARDLLDQGAAAYLGAGASAGPSPAGS